MWDKAFKIMSAGAGVVVALFGGWDTMMMVLFAFMAIDYVTGLLSGMMGKSKKTETGHIDSTIAWKGLVKKCGELIAVIVGVLLDKMANDLGFASPVFRSGIMMYIIATEGISILENLGAMDVPLPPFVVKALEQLQKKSDDIKPVPYGLENDINVTSSSMDESNTGNIH